MASGRRAAAVRFEDCPLRAFVDRMLQTSELTAEVDVLPFRSGTDRPRADDLFYARVKFCCKFTIGRAQRVACMQRLGSAFARHRLALIPSKSARIVPTPAIVREYATQSKSCIATIVGYPSQLPWLVQQFAPRTTCTADA
jgi:hypothetical protein